MDPEITYHLQTQLKQDYLTEQVLNKGYDQIEFAQFLDSKKGESLI